MTRYLSAREWRWPSCKFDEKHQASQVHPWFLADEVRCPPLLHSLCWMLWSIFQSGGRWALWKHLCASPSLIVTWLTLCSRLPLLLYFQTCMFLSPTDRHQIMLWTSKASLSEGDVVALFKILMKSVHQTLVTCKTCLRLWRLWYVLEKYEERSELGWKIRCNERSVVWASTNEGAESLCQKKKTNATSRWQTHDGNHSVIGNATASIMKEFSRAIANIKIEIHDLSACPCSRGQQICKESIVRQHHP